MSYKSSSALIRHELDSILPYEIKAYQSKPVLKTRQFYKPEQFIWNNPHRTSDTIYKFYHKYNDTYQKVKAPLIKYQQKTERELRETNRIKKLTQIRLETRQRFFTKQKDRQALEMLSGTRQRTSPEEFLQTATKRFSTVSHYHSKPTKYDPMIPSHFQSKIPVRKSNSLLKNIEKTYLAGLQRADTKRKLIENLIVTETHKHQNDLREDFERQKELNSKRMSQVTRFQTSKIDVKSVYKEV